MPKKGIFTKALLHFLFLHYLKLVGIVLKQRLAVLNMIISSAIDPVSNWIVL